MNSSSSSAAAKGPSQIKRILVGLVVALVIGASLFGYGYWKGRSQLGAQKANYDSQTQGLQGQLSQSQSDLAAAQNQTRLFQAQADLYRAAIDLEKRNFGLANTHLQESAVLLGTVQNASGVDTARLAALRDTISRTNINVAIDLAAQRQQVLNFAAQLEALTPKPADSAPVVVPTAIAGANSGINTLAVPTPVTNANAPTATDTNTATVGEAASNPANSAAPAEAPAGVDNTANSVGTEQGAASNSAAPSHTTIPAEGAPTAAPIG